MDRKLKLRFLRGVIAFIVLVTLLAFAYYGVILLLKYYFGDEVPYIISFIPTAGAVIGLVAIFGLTLSGPYKELAATKTGEAKAKQENNK